MSEQSADLDALARAWREGYVFVQATQCDNCYSCGGEGVDDAPNPYRVNPSSEGKS